MKKTDDEAFDIWYAAYPRHSAKKDALKAWEKMMNKPPLDQLLAALAEQVSYRREAAHREIWTPEWCYPATWLRGERWNDEMPSFDDEPAGIDPKLQQQIHEMALRICGGGDDAEQRIGNDNKAGSGDVAEMEANASSAGGVDDDAEERGLQHRPPSYPKRVSFQSVLNSKGGRRKPASPPPE